MQGNYLDKVQIKVFLYEERCHNGIAEPVPFVCCTAELHKSINMYLHN